MERRKIDLLDCNCQMVLKVESQVTNSISYPFAFRI